MRYAVVVEGVIRRFLRCFSHGMERHSIVRSGLVRLESVCRKAHTSPRMGEYATILHKLSVGKRRLSLNARECSPEGDYRAIRANTHMLGRSLGVTYDDHL